MACETVIEIPVSVGDTIYVIPTKEQFEQNVKNNEEDKNCVLEVEIAYVQWWNNDEYVLGIKGREETLNSFDFYAVWFPTRETANSAFDRIKATRWDKYGNSKY